MDNAYNFKVTLVKLICSKYKYKFCCHLDPTFQSITVVSYKSIEKGNTCIKICSLEEQKYQ